MTRVLERLVVSTSIGALWSGAVFFGAAVGSPQIWGWVHVVSGWMTVGFLSACLALLAYMIVRD